MLLVDAHQTDLVLGSLLHIVLALLSASAPVSAVVFITDLKGVEGGAGVVGVLGWPGLTTLICSGLV